MRRGRGLVATALFVLLALAWAPPASAAPTQRLAVLELSGAFERDILSVFSDQVRQGALSSLKGTSYEVMTRENMAMLARNMGVDLAACQEGAECEVDIGRNIGAALVISGGVTKVGSSLFCTLKIHTTDKGTLLASKTVKATDEEAMIEALVQETAALIREGLGLGRSRSRRAVAPTTGGAIRGDETDFELEVAAEAVVRFESSPPGDALQGEPLQQEGHLRDPSSRDAGGRALPGRADGDARCGERDGAAYAGAHLWHSLRSDRAGGLGCHDRWRVHGDGAH